MGYPEFGSRDLDQRPAEMMRSSMHGWLQECPHCGYVANDLARGDERDRRYVGSRQYQALMEGPQLSGLTHRFLLRTALERNRANPVGAFVQTLRAAWTADDLNLADYAKALRQRAAAYLADSADLSADAELVHLDVLRRASDWHGAGQLATRLAVRSLDPPASAIVRFQSERITERDHRRYTIARALEATKPHG